MSYESYINFTDEQRKKYFLTHYIVRRQRDGKCIFMTPESFLSDIKVRFNLYSQKELIRYCLLISSKEIIPLGLPDGTNYLITQEGA